ncbi:MULTISPECIES: DUF2752 domain-containing protein [Streptomyces]|uniref:DUF2752 domain-containing protein n=1 Tax=Streptomyces TaxID=1883 RepID=UPI001676831E|nr:MULTISPECIES: DUF2752 domain-containing protein [Streptomyces]MBD3579821.1 DUF2752 domain-containing protein [Streptomyces sp. KD18]GGS94865.1 hypothetical protein GCM10010286_19740 [Streptomyces toxytricini]
MDASRTPRPPAGQAPPPAAAPGPAGPPAHPAPGAPGAPAAVPASRARRLAAPALTVLAAAAAFAYVGAVDPNEPGHYPVCPLFRLSGILCPGCGGLRSAHAFAHGDLAAAFGANAMAVIGYFAFAGFAALWLLRAWRGAPTPRFALKGPYWWALGGAALVFSVVRNLPFGAALAP